MNESTIKDIVEKQLSSLIHFAYLLGSAGTARVHSESDVDLAVYWKEQPDFLEIVKIRENLAGAFCTEVDLVSLNKIDLIFGRQVLETGRLLICNSDGIHLLWKSDQMAQYPDFKFSRKIIEDNILKRKKHV